MICRTGRSRRGEADTDRTTVVSRGATIRASGAPALVARIVPQSEAAVHMKTRVYGRSMRGHVRKRGERGSWEYIVDVGLAAALIAELVFAGE